MICKTSTSLAVAGVHAAEAVEVSAKDCVHSSGKATMIWRVTGELTTHSGETYGRCQGDKNDERKTNRSRVCDRNSSTARRVAKERVRHSHQEVVLPHYEPDLGQGGENDGRKTDRSKVRVCNPNTARSLAIEGVRHYHQEVFLPYEEPDLSTAMVLELSNGVRHRKVGGGKPQLQHTGCNVGCHI